jgi:hypothetical protein
MILTQSIRLQVGEATSGFSALLTCFLELKRIDDLRRLYPKLENIYRRHVEEANFSVVDDIEYKSLKTRLTAGGNLRHALLKSDAYGKLGKKKKALNDISDSDFLRELEGMQDQGLSTPIHDVMVLVHAYLSSLIDATVNTMTYAVLQMQQEECKKSVRHEIETEEKKALDDILVKFIRDVNLKTARCPAS